MRSTCKKLRGMKKMRIKKVEGKGEDMKAQRNDEEMRKMRSQKTYGDDEEEGVQDDELINNRIG